MGLEKVKERVLEEARDKAKAKTDAAMEEARRITSAAQKQAKEKESLFMEKLQAEVEMARKREEAAAKLEAKKQLLSFKKEFVDSVFREAWEKLSKLPEAKRAAHIRQLLRKAADEITVSAVYCSGKDRKHVSGYKAQEQDMLGGIIAESEDGTLRVDYSYETLLGQLKDSLMPELSSMLFGKNK